MCHKIWAHTQVPQNVAHATIVTNMSHATKYGACARKCGANATKSCDTCPVFSWHMSQLFRARPTTFQGMCRNFLWHVPQLFETLATTFCGMCLNLLGHMPHFLWHVPHILWHVAYWSLPLLLVKAVKNVFPSELINNWQISQCSWYYAKACNEWRCSSPRLSAWATQLQRNVAAVASRVVGDTVLT